MLISFSWTTAALLSGAKTMTRRDWSRAHYSAVEKAFLEERPFDAWDHVPRVKGARKVAEIRLTGIRGPESTSLVGDEDYRREGFAWLRAHGSPEERGRVQTIWTQWRFAPQLLYVVEFELVDVVR